MKRSKLTAFALMLLLVGFLGPGSLRAVADAGAAPLVQLQIGADKLAADCASEGACADPAAQIKAMVKKLIDQTDGGFPRERDLSALAFVLGELENKLGAAASGDGPSKDALLNQDVQTLNELIGSLLEEAAIKMQDMRQYAEYRQ